MPRKRPVERGGPELHPECRPGGRTLTQQNEAKYANESAEQSRDRYEAELTKVDPRVVKAADRPELTNRAFCSIRGQKPNSGRQQGDFGQWPERILPPDARAPSYGVERMRCLTQSFLAASSWRSRKSSMR